MPPRCIGGVRWIPRVGRRELVGCLNQLRHVLGGERDIPVPRHIPWDADTDTSATDYAKARLDAIEHGPDERPHGTEGCLHMAPGWPRFLRIAQLYPMRDAFIPKVKGEPEVEVLRDAITPALLSKDRLKAQGITRAIHDVQEFRSAEKQVLNNGYGRF